MMDEAIQLLLIGAGITGAMMTALWALHLWVRNAAVVDVGWASGIGILAVVYAVIGNGDPRHRLIAGILGGVYAEYQRTTSAFVPWPRRASPR